MKVATHGTVCVVYIATLALLFEGCLVESRGGGRGGRSGRSRTGRGGSEDIPWWTYLVALAGAALLVGVGILVTKWCIKKHCDWY